MRGQHTSPQPLAEVTLLKAKLMVPPPFPLWVDKEPDKTAVSFVVRGACSGAHKIVSPWIRNGSGVFHSNHQTFNCGNNLFNKKHTLINTSHAESEATHYLYGLWYVHLVDFHMWDSSSCCILIVLLISVKQVRSINAHTNRSLQLKDSRILVCNWWKNIAL